MVALFRIAALTSLVAMPLSAQVRRNEQPRPPSMTLDEYEPTSMLDKLSRAQVVASLERYRSSSASAAVIASRVGLPE